MGFKCISRRLSQLKLGGNKIIFYVFLHRTLWYNYTTQTNEVYSRVRLIFMMSPTCCEHTMLHIQPVFLRILATRFETCRRHQYYDIKSVRQHNCLYYTR